MKKEQLSDDVTLYCGDCREVLPTLDEVNAVVSDPPYGIEDLVGGYGRTQLAKMGKNDRNIANDTNLDVMVDAFNLVKAKFNDVWIASFYSCRISPKFFLATSMLEYFGEIIWDKRNVGLGNQIRYQHENVAFFKIGNPSQLASCPSVLAYTSLKGDEGDNKKSGTHPHEKPNQVMFNLVNIVPGKIILDPFMGTGSTGAAAIQAKRSFIGVEWEPKYFDMARRKIEEALKQPTAFWE